MSNPARSPITGFSVRVTDTVDRAMAVLKDRRDPASKPAGVPHIGPFPIRQS